MRLTAQNNQFRFHFPSDFIDKNLQLQFNILMDKNYIPYDDVVAYLNSTIKEIVFPGMQFNNVEQTIKRGKKIRYKESQSIFDKHTPEIDITFRAVDSYLNYFILQQVLIEFYLNVGKHNIPMLLLEILDKDGDLIYLVIFKNVFLKSQSEIRLGYQQQDISERNFSVTFQYNFIDIRWELKNNINDQDKTIFDIPINFKKGKLDN